jgi:DamX protein
LPDKTFQTSSANESGTVAAPQPTVPEKSTETAVANTAPADVPVATPEAVPPPEATAPAPAPVTTDPLESRLAATREWLASEDRGTYSIQLMGAENSQHLKHHLNVIGKIIEMNKIFVYPTVAKQKPSLTVLYGSFSDRREARQALETLPASLKAYRPILRTVQGVRSEMRQHQTLEQGNASS